MKATGPISGLAETSSEADVRWHIDRCRGAFRSGDHLEHSCFSKGKFTTPDIAPTIIP